MSPWYTSIHMFEKVIIYSPIWLSAIIIPALCVIFLAPALALQYLVLFGAVFTFIAASSFFWFPLFLTYAFWKVWMVYIRSRYLYKLEWVLLEIKLPQEITKSPLAMETFLTTLYQTGKETTFIDRHWKGQLRAHYSLEIVSIEGKIKFFIYTRSEFRRLIEAGLYAQYESIEIHEVPDYAKSFHFDPKENDLYAVDMKLKNPDPYPIKTYVDYNLEKEGVDEENKIDPINTIIEFMGSIGANQQAWLQVIIRAHKKDSRKQGTWFDQTDKWKDEAKEEIEKIRKEAIPKGDDTTKFPNPTKGQQERIAALERSISKYPFDVGVRAIYMGKKDFFDGTNISGLRVVLRAYGAPHLNEFSCANWLNDFDYPWQDFMNIRQNGKKRGAVEAYKRRSFFYAPEIGEPFILNVEELASIFHLPGKVSQTPNLARIPSKRSQAPANLPI